MRIHVSSPTHPDRRYDEMTNFYDTILAGVKPLKVTDDEIWQLVSTKVEYAASTVGNTWDKPIEDMDELALLTHAAFIITGLPTEVRAGLSEHGLAKILTIMGDHGDGGKISLNIPPEHPRMMFGDWWTKPECRGVVLESAFSPTPEAIAAAQLVMQIDQKRKEIRQGRRDLLHTVRIIVASRYAEEEARQEKQRKTRKE